MSSSWGRSALLGLVAIVCALLAVPAFADSQVRIVRLSDMNGDVLIDRGAGQGFERALLNMPIVQGTKLWTKSNDARAEVEFENGSAVRLAPGSQVSFPKLALTDSGVKASTIEVSEGTVYFNLNKDKGDEFQVQFGRDQVNVAKSANFRLDVNNAEVKLAVLKGDVEVQERSGTVKIAKDKTATFDLADNTSTVAKGVALEPLDSWNKNESEFQRQYAGAGAPYHTPYAYGLSDLNYYGDYYYIAPYGWVWQPFGVGAAWNPFMNGAWSYYPGFGYSWVSTYPWGWLPYRYGAWAYIPGWGWGWQPSGYWNGFVTAPVIINPPAGFVAPKTPMGGTRTVVVNPPGNRPPGAGAAADKPGFVNDHDNATTPPGKGQTLNAARTPEPVHGASAITGRRGEVPSQVHGATMVHGVAAPRPSMGSERGFGGFSRSGGFEGSGGFGRGSIERTGGVGSSGSHSSAGSSGGHSSSPH